MSRLVLSVAPGPIPDSENRRPHHQPNYSQLLHSGAARGRGRAARFRRGGRSVSHGEPTSAGERWGQLSRNAHDLGRPLRRAKALKWTSSFPQCSNQAPSRSPSAASRAWARPRSAREVARRLGEGGCEISWLDLSGNVIGLGLEAALARSLGTQTLSPTDLRLALRTRQVVLVIDGADRFAADIVHTLQALAICPRLRVVVTSVRRLKGRVTKEVVLQGLECPPAEWIPSRDPTRYEAIELFTAVASSISPHLDLGDVFQAEIAPICRALDGLPLAIILVAARVVRSIGVHAGHSHLIERDSGFGLELIAKLRDTDHKEGGSVRDALGRTYLSLDSLEQRVWEWTSVFERPFDLEAAEQVSGMTRYALVGPLEELVDLRVIEPGPTGDQPRYVLSSLSRAFARSQLERRAETRVVTDRHAVVFASWSAVRAAGTHDCEPLDRSFRPGIGGGAVPRCLDHLFGDRKPKSGARAGRRHRVTSPSRRVTCSSCSPASKLWPRYSPDGCDPRTMAHALLWTPISRSIASSARTP